jgi:hypothetical protein
LIVRAVAVASSTWGRKGGATTVPPGSKEPAYWDN